MLSTVLASSHEYLGGLRCCQHKTSSTETEFFLSEWPTKVFFLCVCDFFGLQSFWYYCMIYGIGEAVATSLYSCPRTLLDWRHGRVDFQIFLAVSVEFCFYFIYPQTISSQRCYKWRCGQPACLRILAVCLPPTTLPELAEIPDKLPKKVLQLLWYNVLTILRSTANKYIKDFTARQHLHNKWTTQWDLTVKKFTKTLDIGLSQLQFDWVWRHLVHGMANVHARRITIMCNKMQPIRLFAIMSPLLMPTNLAL